MRATRSYHAASSHAFFVGARTGGTVKKPHKPKSQLQNHRKAMAPKRNYPKPPENTKVQGP